MVKAIKKNSYSYFWLKEAHMVLVIPSHQCTDDKRPTVYGKFKLCNCSNIEGECSIKVQYNCHVVILSVESQFILITTTGKLRASY